MANIERNANVVWHGTLREGNGKMSTGSGALREVPYKFATRFEQAPGTNPEELLAAAHALDSLHPLTTTAELQRVLAAVRAIAPFRPAGHRLDRDMTRLAALVESGALSSHLPQA